MFVRSRTIATSTPLDNGQLLKAAPSVFANAAHASRSSRYTHIPTIQVVDALRDNGFLPMVATQSRCRSDESRQDYTKHMIRFRHVDHSAATLCVGEVFPEVILINSHDGTSSYKLHAGLFRLVCSNGMVADQGELGGVRIQHSGDAIRGVIDASFSVLDASRRTLTTANQWRQITLTPRQQEALAIGAHHLRFADADGNVETPVTPSQMLHVRRVADQGSDLWSTFNRVQENAIRGGLHAVAHGADGRRRRVTTREVKGIDGNLNLNKALWKLAEHLAATAAN